MEKYSKDAVGEEAIKDQLREGFAKNACDYDPSNREFDDILPHLLNIYASHATPQDFDIYAPDATFEDPLMRAQGIKQIKSAFYSIPKIENGKIVRHEDWWDQKPLWNSETVRLPLVGRLAAMTRRASMLVTHCLMRFGKDPSN